jgi:hypothetical protein
MKSTRRSFVGAAGAFSTLLVARFPTPALAVVPPEVAPDASVPAKAADAGSPAAKAPPEGLARIARERYGKFLDEKQLGMLDEKIAAVEANSKRLQAVKLANGDEPATEFRAERW